MFTQSQPNQVNLAEDINFISFYFIKIIQYKGKRRKRVIKFKPFIYIYL
jgi:hypothetical protein